MREWRTVEQEADRLQVGRKVIYRAVKEGQLKAVRIGGRRDIRLLPEWIDDWLIKSARFGVEAK